MWDVLPADWHIVGIGDFNGDGYDDLLLRNDDGTVTDWLGTADAGFNDNWDNSQNNPGTAWTVVGTNDFNGDGRADVLRSQNDGTSTDWLGTASGGFFGNWDNYHNSVPTYWHAVGTGNFNGDGLADILWRDDWGVVTDWLGQSNGGFVGNWDNYHNNPGTSWQVAGTGDFNGDGIDDILWRADDGTVTDWLGTANGSFAGNWDIAHYNPGTGWNVVGTGDFNGDGRADILWRSIGDTITDWLGQADGSFIDNWNTASQQVSSDLQIAGVGDFNGDGRSDVLLRGSDGTLETWLGAVDGAILSPMEKLWKDALANVSKFFNEMTDQVESYTPRSGDQASTYDMGDVGGSIGSDFDALFLEFYSFTQSVQQYFAAHSWDFLTNGTNLNFQFGSEWSQVSPPNLTAILAR